MPVARDQNDSVLFFNLLLGEVGMVRDLTNKRITERAVRNYAVLPAEFLQTKLYKTVKNMKKGFGPVRWE